MKDGLYNRIGQEQNMIIKIIPETQSEKGPKKQLNTTMSKNL